MKKAAIVTLYHNNYNFGGQLQAYALQRTVELLGDGDIECSVIDYAPENKYKRLRVLSCKTILQRFIKKTQMKYHKIKNKEFMLGFDKKTKLFDEFMQLVRHTEEYTNDTICKISDTYDYWITGSDQVWNPETYIGAPLYFLKGMRGIKIAYAASSLLEYNSVQEKEIYDALEDFAAVSVRECGYARTISHIINCDVDVVLDPTLLLCAKDWNQISVEPSIQERYAFVYLINASDKERKNVYFACKRHGLRVVIVPHAQGWYHCADDKYYDIRAAAIGPREWIGYIKNAEIVITDSFHGTIFSVNYHKRFLSFDNITGNEQADIGLRKYSILNMLGLSERCVPYGFNPEQPCVFEDIDYTEADRKLQSYRESSLQFLKDALQVREGR